MLDEILLRIERGVRSIRTAVVVNDRVLKAREVDQGLVEEWRSTALGRDYADDICNAEDRLFPIRLPLVPSSGDDEPIGFILVGPRPDGSIPSRDEQRALADVSEGIARGIRTVMKREERESAVAELIAANSRRIEELETMLGSTRPRPA